MDTGLKYMAIATILSPPTCATVTGGLRPTRSLRIARTRTLTGDLRRPRRVHLVGALEGHVHPGLVVLLHADAGKDHLCNYGHDPLNWDYFTITPCRSKHQGSPAPGSLSSMRRFQA